MSLTLAQLREREIGYPDGQRLAACPTGMRVRVSIEPLPMVGSNNRVVGRRKFPVVRDAETGRLVTALYYKTKAQAAETCRAFGLVVVE